MLCCVVYSDFFYYPYIIYNVQYFLTSRIFFSHLVLILIEFKIPRVSHGLCSFLASFFDIFSIGARYSRLCECYWIIVFHISFIMNYFSSFVFFSLFNYYEVGKVVTYSVN